MLRSLLLVFLLALAGCAARVAPIEPYPEPAQREALRLYVPLRCDYDGGFYLVGTGFPVAHDRVLTAAHIHCSENEVMSLSPDYGETWIRPLNRLQRRDFDVAVFFMEPNTFSRIAEFRPAVPGETVHGFGVALGGQLSKGIVSGRHEPSHQIYFSNIPYSGLSGSAIIGEDNKVVGMMLGASPDFRLSSTVSRGYSALLLQELLAKLEEHLNATDPVAQFEKHMDALDAALKRAFPMEGK